MAEEDHNTLKTELKVLMRSMWLDNSHHLDPHQFVCGARNL